MAVTSKFGANDGPHLNLRLTPAMDERLRALATRQQVGCSELVRKWIETGLKRAEGAEDRARTKDVKR